MPERLLILGHAQQLDRFERQLELVAEPPVVVARLETDRIPGSADGLLQIESAVTAAMTSTSPDAAIVCLPAAFADAISAVRTVLRRLGLPDRYVPSMEDLIAGVGPRNLVEVDPAALLGRTPRSLDRGAAARVIEGRRVLITGAGGSIGGEIARLVAGQSPASLVLLERSENALFEIDRQVAAIAPELPRRAILHDVVDADRTREYFTSLRPDVVFHAAAHKHVPMMEDHPGAAIDNNVFGTLSVLEASVHAGTGRFVLISSDKAVNPVSVMGMTKRLAELCVRHVDRSTTTTCSMVRFGNVLASNGSVLETWTRQLRAGGPITVTDPRMTRYFMTIREAAGLVIEAAALVEPGHPRGDVFVLDMGEPVSIDGFARRFVEAHGLEPVPAAAIEIDQPGQAVSAPSGASAGPSTIRIVYTGARPGEKLHEDLGHRAEQMRPTAHPGINAWHEPWPEADLMEEILSALRPGRRVRDPRMLTADLRRLIARADAAMEAAAASSVSIGHAIGGGTIGGTGSAKPGGTSPGPRAAGPADGHSAPPAHPGRPAHSDGAVA
ncbi:MAG: polysaccharide biosynthesis protein [Phycisphaerales bacterium]